MRDECINVIPVTATPWGYHMNSTSLAVSVRQTDTGLGLSEPTFNLSEAQTAYSGSAYFHCETTLWQRNMGCRKLSRANFDVLMDLQCKTGLGEHHTKLHAHRNWGGMRTAVFILRSVKKKLSVSVIKTSQLTLYREF